MKRSASMTANRPARLDIEQMRLITKVARLHFIHGERQAEIAEKMGVSQASVSRLLTLAQEYEIVRTIIVPPKVYTPISKRGWKRLTVSIQPMSLISVRTMQVLRKYSGLLRRDVSPVNSREALCWA